MIISASRRTDIPAFYSEWLVNRLREGFVYVRNPVNPKHISNVPLNPDVVDCIVFWTKDARPILKHLKKIDSMGFPYYFQFTLTAYDSRVEPCLADKAEIIEGFKMLSERIGKSRIVWRYDPVVVNEIFSVDYHLDHFYSLCRSLAGFTRRCIFSYVDLYAKVKRNARGMAINEVDYESMDKIARGFAEIAPGHDITLQTCCEAIDLSQYGIGHAACIDREIIENLIGYPIKAKKDINQRHQCRCIESIDVGAYDSCSHGCLYCYATSNYSKVHRNMAGHHVDSPLLIGQPCSGDIIKDRIVKSFKNTQSAMF